VSSDDSDHPCVIGVDAGYSHWIDSIVIRPKLIVFGVKQVDLFCFPKDYRLLRHVTAQFFQNFYLILRLKKKNVVVALGHMVTPILAKGVVRLPSRAKVKKKKERKKERNK
jgi:hypothetical protein